MALFTNKADADLPLLTKLYQVSPELGPTVPDVMASEIAKFMRIELKEQDLREPSESDIVSMARLLKTVKAMMDGAADGEPPLPEIEWVMQDYLNIYLKPPTLGFIFVDKEQGHKPFVHYLGLHDTNSVTQDEETFDLICQMVLQSLVIMWERAEFRRCEVCSSVFVMNPKRKQKFCSQRCRARLGSRRRYAILFDGLPSYRVKKKVLARRKNDRII